MKIDSTVIMLSVIVAIQIRQIVIFRRALRFPYETPAELLAAQR